MPKLNMHRYDPERDSSPDILEYRKQTDFDGVLLLIPPGCCLCGCGETPKGKNAKFAMGHDARYRGKLIRAHCAGVEVAVTTGEGGQGEAVFGTAMQWAADHGWEHYLEAAYDREQKLKADADRKVTSRAMRTARDEADGKLKVGDKRLVKVGRWEYTGQVLAIYSDGTEAELEYSMKDGTVGRTTVPVEKLKEAVG